jgi:hypothetical protein
MSRRRCTIEEMQAIARERGGGCLSTNYITSCRKLTWRCRMGHEWEAVPLSIKQGSWCPACARVRKGTIAELLGDGGFRFALTPDALQTFTNRFRDRLSHGLTGFLGESLRQRVSGRVLNVESHGFLLGRLISTFLHYA